MKKVKVTIPKEEVNHAIPILNDEKIKYNYSEDDEIYFWMTPKELFDFIKIF